MFQIDGISGDLLFDSQVVKFSLFGIAEHPCAYFVQHKTVDHADQSPRNRIGQHQIFHALEVRENGKYPEYAECTRAEQCHYRRPE